MKMRYGPPITATAAAGTQDTFNADMNAYATGNGHVQKANQSDTFLDRRRGATRNGLPRIDEVVHFSFQK